MAGRKQTPDIMADLMAGNASKPASQPNSKPAKRQARRKAPAPKPSPTAPEKTKATFYLTGDGMDSLEASWMMLRQLAGKDRGKVSKSALVEVALVKLQKELKDSHTALAILQAVRKEGTT